MLERLGLVGISWRQGSSEALAEFALEQDRAAAQLAEFAERLQLAELAYLATCNRVELIFARSERTPSVDLRREAFTMLTGRAPAGGEAERRLKAWQGEGAAEHLFLTAAGLDSACVGETEIVGQVRSAQERALTLGLCGPSLALVFEEALKIAARVRGETKLGEGRVSLAEIAVQALRERLARTPGPTALVGVSPMTERAALSLAQAGLDFFIVNRSFDKAEALAARFGATPLALEEFVRKPPAIEALLSATGAEHAILNGAALERLAAHTPSGQPPLVIDMAIPPDVAPADCERLAIARIGMDEIVERAERNRAARLMEAGPAREQVDEALEKLQDRFTERYYGPLLGALQQRYRKTAEEGVARLLKKELKNLGDSERAAITTWSEVLARRFAHIPVPRPARPAARRSGRLDRRVPGRSRARVRGRAAGRARRRSAHPAGGRAAGDGGGRQAMSVTLRLGTRGSALALTQSGAIAERLRAAGHAVELTVIRTAGDRDTTAPFGSIGPQGVFVREIEQALVERRIELAVHSFKDLPTRSPPELAIAAVPERADPADLLFVRAEALAPDDFLPLRAHARVGTASARRRVWLEHFRPDLVIEPLRGNVPTRLQRLVEGRFDAILLAAAGVARLRAENRLDAELEGLTVVRLDPERFVPAPAQGALALQCRRDAPEVVAALAPLEHLPTRLAIAAERDALARAEGGCDVAFGAYCVRRGDAHELLAMHERAGRVRTARASGADPAALGAAVWRTLEAGGEAAR